MFVCRPENWYLPIVYGYDCITRGIIPISLNKIEIKRIPSKDFQKYLPIYTKLNFEYHNIIIRYLDTRYTGIPPNGHKIDS